MTDVHLAADCFACCNNIYTKYR